MKFKKIEIICIVVCLLILAGCVDKSVYGRYTQEGSTLTLQEDGTYLYTPAGSAYTQKGTFTQNGDSIQLTNILGITTTLKITKAGLVDKDNELWIKVQEKS